jgi:tRNA (guanine-N7-)-methyltransferase
LTTPPVPFPRPVRSFVLRAGRMGSGQSRALADLGPRFLIPFERDHPLDLARVFGREAPRILEIGFGMGETTATIAAGNPDRDYLGIEVHTPGVGALLKRIGEVGLENVRIIQHDAVDVLEHMLPDACLDGAHIFFPDPWPKKKHHKRRLVQGDFIRLLTRKLKPDAYLHLATDWEDYAQRMLDVLRAEPWLINTCDDFAHRPAYRPLTKFERRGLKLGHGVWDLLFRKRRDIDGG